MWTAHSPAVPGAYGIGTSKKAALRDLAAAFETLFSYLEERGVRAFLAVGAARR